MAQDWVTLWLSGLAVRMLPPAHLASSAQNGGTELAVAVCPMEELCSMGHTVGELCCTVLPCHSVEEIKGKSKCRRFWEWWGKAWQTNHSLKENKYSASPFLSCLILFLLSGIKVKAKILRFILVWQSTAPPLLCTGRLWHRLCVSGDCPWVLGTAPVCWALPLYSGYSPYMLGTAPVC